MPIPLDVVALLWYRTGFERYYLYLKTKKEGFSIHFLVIIYLMDFVQEGVSKTPARREELDDLREIAAHGFKQLLDEVRIGVRRKALKLKFKVWGTPERRMYGMGC